MDKKVIIIIISIIGISILAMVALHYKNSNKPINKDLKVISFGDSLVAGQGATKGHDFSSVLSQRLGIQIINKGKNGDTTSGGLSRLESDVLSENPNIVILLLGGNDALQRIPPTQTFTNLKEITTRLQSANIKVLLLGIQGGILGDPFADQFGNLVDELNVPYVPNVLSGLWGDSRYMSDSVHPNDMGYAKIADRIEPELKKLLQ